jgi:hypothetical protein
MTDKIKGNPEAERNLYGLGRNPGAKRLADQHDAEHRQRLAAGARFNRAKYGDDKRARD